VLFDDIDGFPRRHRRGKRAEVAVAILHDLSRSEDSRPRMLRRHFDAQVTLVVLQPDVVARLVLLDEIVFENQRFFGIARHQRFDVFHAANQEFNLAALVGAIEIGSHPSA